MNPEENTIVYVISSVMENRSNEYQYDYDFTVESIINENGSDYDNLDEVTTEFGKEYMIGYTFAKRKLLLKAEKKGLYKFSFTWIDSYSHAQIYIDDGTPYGGQSGPNLELDAGEYVIVLTTNDHLFDICSIRYEFFDTGDRDVDVTLDVAENKGSIGKILNLKVTETQIVRYHFNLTEQSVIVYSKSDVCVYDNNGKKVSVNSPFYGGTYGFIRLKAGSYYAIYTGSPYSVSGEYEHDKYFALSIETFNLDHYFDPEDIPNFEYGKEYVLKETGKLYNFLCFKYVVVKGEKVGFITSNVEIEIYDEDLNKIGYNLMEEGKTYYFVIVGKATYEYPTITFVLK